MSCRVSFCFASSSAREKFSTASFSPAAWYLCVDAVQVEVEQQMLNTTTTRPLQTPHTHLPRRDRSTSVTSSDSINALCSAAAASGSTAAAGLDSFVLGGMLVVGAALLLYCCVDCGPAGCWFLYLALLFVPIYNKIALSSKTGTYLR